MATKPRYTQYRASTHGYHTPSDTGPGHKKLGLSKPPDSTHLHFSVSPLRSTTYQSHNSNNYIACIRELVLCPDWTCQVRYLSCDARGPNRVIYTYPGARTSQLLAGQVEVERTQPKPQYCQRFPLRPNHHRRQGWQHTSGLLI